MPERSDRPRLILYVGKGGVGKTTIAAATAVRAAALGHRTLLVSTDIAHSLGDVLDTPLAADPRPVAERLDAQEVNVLEEMRRSWGKVQAQLAEFLRREGLPDIQADELAIMPGLDEIAALVQIGRQIRSADYDCIVVDAAPTGETIRLLSTPDAFQSYAGRIYGWRGRLLGIAGPFLRNALPDLNVVDVMARLAARIKELRTLLIDPRRSSYRLVVTPDRMVLKEALRAETYLNVFEYPIDAVICNRILVPPEPEHPFLAALLARQQTLIAEIRNAFAALPIFEVPFWTEEPIGCAQLGQLAVQVFGGQDPTAVLHVGPTQRIVATAEAYLLQIPLPHVEIDTVAMMKRGDALYLDVGNVRREIMLPTTLAGLEPATARLRDGVLEIPFLRTSQPTVSGDSPKRTR